MRSCKMKTYEQKSFTQSALEKKDLENFEHAWIYSKVNNFMEWTFRFSDLYEAESQKI